MKFNEIMTAQAIGGSESEFKKLHTEIMANGNMAAECAVAMALKLKEMRDSKLYEAAGFGTFGEYTETACGIKERQAYNYISIVEKLDKTFLQTTANIGVSKLAILAGMDEGDRADLIEEHGEELKEMTTKEIDKLRKEYEARYAQLKMELEGEIRQRDGEIYRLEQEGGAQEWEDTVKRLRSEIEELKSAPPKKDLKAELELEKKREEVKKLKEAKAAAEKAAKEAKERADKEIEEGIAKEREALKAAEQTLEYERARIAEQEKKAKIAADPAVSEFKVKFKLWQEIGNGLTALIEGMDIEWTSKCVKAMTAVIEGIKEALK